MADAGYIDISAWKRTQALAGVVWEVLTQRKAARKLGPASWACHSSIKGKTVIITGATSGIGFETARELVISGAHVVLACRRPHVAEELVEQWRKTIPNVSAEVLSASLPLHPTSSNPIWKQTKKKPLESKRWNCMLFDTS